MGGSNVAAVTHRFERHELAVRRLYSSNPEFRTLCEDYAEAVRALAVWQGDHARAEEYRLLVGELEAEILASLQAGGIPGGRR